MQATMRSQHAQGEGPGIYLYLPSFVSHKKGLGVNGTTHTNTYTRRINAHVRHPRYSNGQNEAKVSRTSLLLQRGNIYLPATNIPQEVPKLGVHTPSLLSPVTSEGDPTSHNLKGAAICPL
ncbi:hypothetical protein FRC08_014047 [Ceratobasidium sp. 394]|nr:hypothetical protein FRC08_014047 [Ceratobasidium sp. 394]KAG9075373.1 hypothetical protein FS749_012969 [Ceratobasidium sp. UAMH 11750]